jgi:hypothetical protein
MTATLLVDLVTKLAWPLVVVACLLAFRKALLHLIDRTRELEGPGDLKIRLDPTAVQEIVEDGRRQNLPAKEVTKRIMEDAVIDEREFRILRALLGETDGRSMYSYQSSYYQPALNSVMNKSLVMRNADKFRLTEKGIEVLRNKLLPLLVP